MKYRPSGAAGLGLQAVGRDKMRRMLEAAQLYMLTHDLMELQPRFDLVEITGDGVLHVPNAFGALS